VSLLVFTSLARLFHGMLADRRPDIANLTKYYLWVSVGGALGGQQRLQSLYLLLVLLEIGNVGDHGGVLSGSGGMEWNDF
jgi:hypothetical protein